MVSIIFIFIFQTNLFAQQNPVKKTPQELASLYENSVVKIRNDVKWSNGEVENAIGSGFFVNNEGLIMTCAHVVKLKKETKKVEEDICRVVGYNRYITIKNDSKRYRVEVLGIDAGRDLALLKAIDIPKNEYRPATLGNSNDIKIGEMAFAYGYPLGLNQTFTHGIVSALHRHPNLYKIEDFIQVDTLINPGNSGGPLINELGEVVGVVSLVHSQAQGISYAIPINLVEIERLKKGDVLIGYLGIKILLDNFPRSEVISFEEIKYMNDLTQVSDVKTLVNMAEITKDNCAMILEVDSNSPGSKAFMKKGDIIKTFNKKQVKSGRDVIYYMSYVKPKEIVEMEVIRVDKEGGKTVILTATVSEWPTSRPENDDF